MEKISTLYRKDPTDLGRVINEVAPENNWVIEGDGVATQKFDGTATAVINGKLYKRYDVKLFKRKRGKIITFTEEQIKAKIPNAAIACQDADEKSGHWPHWVECDRDNPADKLHFEAFDAEKFEDGTYEFCGEKVQDNPEKITGHKLIKHGSVVLPITDYTYDGLRKYLETAEMEGIVFYHKTDGRMCKIRKCDFGIVRGL
jgi:hypothetical protein